MHSLTSISAVPRHPHFNPKKQTKTASYWKTFEHLNETTVDYLDEVYRKRLQALQAVDEMIPTIIAELEIQGKLDNTYIIYSADNGYVYHGKFCYALLRTVLLVIVSTWANTELSQESALNWKKISSEYQFGNVIREKKDSHGPLLQRSFCCAWTGRTKEPREQPCQCTSRSRTNLPCLGEG